MIIKFKIYGNNLKKNINNIFIQKKNNGLIT